MKVLEGQKDNFNCPQEIDENSQDSHAVEPPKATLNFKNGSSVEFKENDKNINWEAVTDLSKYLKGLK